MEAADTVTKLAEKYGIHISDTQTFNEPYVDEVTTKEIHEIVKKTQGNTRSKNLLLIP